MKSYIDPWFKTKNVDYLFWSASRFTLSKAHQYNPLGPSLVWNDDSDTAFQNAEEDRHVQGLELPTQGEKYEILTSVKSKKA